MSKNTEMSSARSLVQEKWLYASPVLIPLVLFGVYQFGKKFAPKHLPHLFAGTIGIAIIHGITLMSTTVRPAQEEFRR